MLSRFIFQTLTFESKLCFMYHIHTIKCFNKKFSLTNQFLLSYIALSWQEYCLTYNLLYESLSQYEDI